MKEKQKERERTIIRIKTKKRNQRKNTFIKTSPKHLLQDHKAGRVIIDDQDT